MKVKVENNIAISLNRLSFIYCIFLLYWKKIKYGKRIMENIRLEPITYIVNVKLRQSLKSKYSLHIKYSLRYT